MPRGDGKAAKSAARADTGIEAYVKPQSGGPNGQALEYIDWSEIEPQKIAHAAWAAGRMGGAILFGSNRDKTCYSISIYKDGRGAPYYFPCNAAGVDDLEQFLDGFIATAARMQEAG